MPDRDRYGVARVAAGRHDSRVAGRETPAMASAPADPTREIARALRACGLAGRRIAVAASGGLDSTVLAHVLASSAPAGVVCAGLLHVHHGLRGAEADADEQAVAALARSLAVPFSSRRVAPRALREGGPSRDRPTLQEAARGLRRAALLEMAETLGADAVATAHHADDQAETVLMRLLRGTGPDALGGIAETAAGGRIVRPLLRVARAGIEAHARRHDLTWREDASNLDPAYARGSLRSGGLAELARAQNPRWLRAIADLAEAQRRDAEWIAGVVTREAERRFSVEGGWLWIDGKDFDALPEALARRLVREALRRCGTGRLVSRAHLERALAFLRQGRVGTRLELPGDLRLVREARGLRLGPLPCGGKTAC
jgi:tRNA(Ile)-lysidine synthase